MMPSRMLRLTAVLGLVAAALVPLGCANEEPFRRAASPEEKAEGDVLAKKLVAAMGGLEAWERVEVLSFTFVATVAVEVMRRSHVWDKRRGLHRYQKGDLVVYTDLWSRKGRVFDQGKEVTDADGVASALKDAHEAFINDSYWLVAPFKVLDEGTHRAAVGGDLRLTFDDGVGLTSGDAYLYDLDESGAPKQWSFLLESGRSGTYPFEGRVEKEGVVFFTDRPSTPVSIRIEDLDVTAGPRPAAFEPLKTLRPDAF